MAKGKEFTPLLDTGISRRTFLKWTGAIGGAAALSASLLDYDPELLKAAPEPNVSDATSTGLPYGADKIVPVKCGLGDVCGMYHMGQAYVKNGKIVYYEGCPEAENKGALCLRGISAMQIMNHPDRCKYPMKRLNPKGEVGKFERISWDEAYDTIADAMVAAIKDGECYKVSVQSGHTMTLITHMVYDRFRTMFRFSSYGGSGGCWSDLQVGGGVTLGDYYHAHLEDFHHSKLIVLWGHNKALAMPSEWSHGIWKAKQEYGAKIIVIDPRFSETAEKADLYLPLRPGTDATLALGMANVIITEGLTDNDFIAKYTTGYESFRELALQYPPEKVEEITWCPADRIRQAARWYATMKPAILEFGRGGNYSGGKDSNSGWMASRAATCLIGLCGQAGMKGAAYSIESSGGNTNRLHFHWPNAVWDDATSPSKPLLTRTMARPRDVWETAEILYNHKPYAYRVYMTSANPASASGDQAKAEWAFNNIPMVVVHNRFMHWTTSLCADIVLPVASWAEQVEYRADWEAMVVSAPAIEPMFECKSDNQIYKDISRGLAKKLNLDVTPEEVWPYENDEDVVNAIVQHPLTKAEYEKRIAQGYTEFEEYRDLNYEKAVAHPEGIPGPFSANLPDFVPYKAKLYPGLPSEGTDPEEIFFPTYNGDRPESNGKLLFKADWLADIGLPILPVPDEPEDHYYKDINPIESGNFELSDAVKNGYQFVAVGKGHRHWGFLSFDQNYDGGVASALRREAHETAAEPCVEMNPRDADRLGLKRGDYVTIESQYGKMEHIKLLLSECVMPKTIVPPYHWGNVQNRIYPYSLSFGSLPIDVAATKLNPRMVGEWGAGKKPGSMGGQNTQTAALCKVYKV